MKPEFKLLPCIFCTLGYNSYVAGQRLVTLASNSFSKPKSMVDTDQHKAAPALADTADSNTSKLRIN